MRLLVVHLACVKEVGSELEVCVLMVAVITSRQLYVVCEKLPGAHDPNPARLLTLTYGIPSVATCVRFAPYGRMTFARFD